MCVGLGGDPIPGTRFAGGLRLLAEDPRTEAVLLIGEIGGSDEEDAAEVIRGGYPKPVFAYVAGVCAPAETRMGHAGAFISVRQGGREVQDPGTEGSGGCDHRFAGGDRGDGETRNEQMIGECDHTRSQTVYDHCRNEKKIENQFNRPNADFIEDSTEAIYICTKTMKK